MRPDGPRDPVAGPDSGPEPPFPIKISGPVIRGFGRGSKEVNALSLSLSLSPFGVLQASRIKGPSPIHAISILTASLPLLLFSTISNQTRLSHALLA
jgi:hypothetical protein